MADALPKTITFALQGSAPQPYRITFEWHQSEIRAFCNCAAGLHGQYCKHRVQLLHGVMDDVVEGKVEQLSDLAEWLQHSPLRLALVHLDEAEFAMEHAKQRVVAARKALSSAMRGNKGGE